MDTSVSREAVHAGCRVAIPAALLLGAALLGQSLTRPAAHGPSTAFGTFGNPGAELDGGEVRVYPDFTEYADGSAQAVYEMPDGSVMRTTTPPPDFDPLTAGASELAAYDFPARPTEPEELADWTTAMAAFEWSEGTDEPLDVATEADAEGHFVTYYTNWAGYIVGDVNAQNHMYVAVKGNLTVPTNSGTCSSSNIVGFWIGLGGTAHSNDLVQQGVECGSPAVGSGSAYRPFTEFANTAPPVAFCGFTSWTLPAGHVIYQNMSFQTSVNKAFFYLEDQTSGTAHSCSRTAPSGWSWDLNTAEWIAEAPTGTSINFGSVRFSNARAQLSSNSSWVTLASQTESKTIQGGDSTSHYCISPGAISTAGDAFTDSWHSPGDCYDWD